MTSRQNVQNTRIPQQIRDLHEALIDLAGLMNRPQRDETLVREAGISLDRALFPLLVGIERRGPIGIVELADGIGRDYTTVSRQVAKLESLELVDRRRNAADRRVNEAAITPTGKAMVDKIDAARERLAITALESWEPAEIDELVRLMRKLATAIEN